MTKDDSAPLKGPSRRPENTAFKQQRLRAFQPVLTPRAVLPCFFALGALFLPLGIGLLLAVQSVIEHTYNYSNCASLAPSPSQPPNTTVSPPPPPILAWTYDNTTRRCSLLLDVPKALPGPVYMYYRLTKFYQNHRKYVKSLDWRQLGAAPATSVVGCKQLGKAKDVAREMPGAYPWISPEMVADDAVVYPCGLIANSFFT
ncbi:hypothetical protein HDU96_003528, partial [Phlyctochytrium bullatum]